MRRNKSDYIVIAFGCILVFIVMVIAFVSTTQKSSPTTKALSPTPQPSPTDDSQENKPQVYDATQQHTLIQKIEKRPPLSQSDLAAKSSIVTAIPVSDGYGVVYESQQIRIDYTKASDLFQVEILTANINDAKGEGNKWFRDHGISQQGICDLPVDFYISWDVRQALGNKIISFSPLANGCR